MSRRVDLVGRLHASAYPSAHDTMPDVGGRATPISGPDDEGGPRERDAQPGTVSGRPGVQRPDAGWRRGERARRRIGRRAGRDGRAVDGWAGRSTPPSRSARRRSCGRRSACGTSCSRWWTKTRRHMAASRPPMRCPKELTTSGARVTRRYRQRLRQAMQPPLQIMERGCDVLRLAGEIAEIGNPDRGERRWLRRAAG